MGNGTEGMKHQLARSGGCVDPLFQADQVNLSDFEIIDCFQ